MHQILPSMFHIWDQLKAVHDSVATRLEYMMIDYTFAVACMMFSITYLHCGPPLMSHMVPWEARQVTAFQLHILSLCEDIAAYAISMPNFPRICMPRAVSQIGRWKRLLVQTSVHCRVYAVWEYLIYYAEIHNNSPNRSGLHNSNT